MNKLFIPKVQPYLETGPVVLFFDGHHSHLSVQLIATCKAKNIWLYCLPPNTTHVLQPLDVGVFGPAKAAWKSIVKTYKLQTRAACITKEVFPSLVHSLCTNAFKPCHFQSAFGNVVSTHCSHQLFRATKLQHQYHLMLQLPHHKVVLVLQ